MVEPRSLPQCYLTSVYTVEAAGSPLRLRVGTRERRLAALHTRYGVRTSAYITAWNPRSKRCPASQNRGAQRRLIQQLRAMGHRVLHGTGMAPDGSWREPSVLVLGLSQQSALRLARRYRQNAVLVCDRSGMPRLVFASLKR